MRHWQWFKMESRQLVKWLIGLNLIFFSYQLFGFGSLSSSGRQAPCIVVMNSSFNSNQSKQSAFNQVVNPLPEKSAIDFPFIPKPLKLKAPPEVNPPEVAVPLKVIPEVVPSKVVLPPVIAPAADTLDSSKQVLKPNSEQLQYEQEHIEALPLEAVPNAAKPIANQSNKMVSNTISIIKSAETKKSLWWTTETRTGYTVLRNYIISETQHTNPSLVPFDNTVTYTTQASYEFLKHSEELCRRFDGPVSLAIYSPGSEFLLAVNLIYHLRECGHACVRNNISWHLIYDNRLKPPSFDGQQTPDEFLVQNEINMVFDCTESFSSFSDRLILQHFPNKTAQNAVLNIRAQKQLPYPINVLRNVARLAAPSKYVLASDIELYPSINVVSMFRELLAKERSGQLTLVDLKKPHVYVFPIFEVKATVKAPETKAQLVKMLASGDAIPFHKWVCDSCQNFVDRAKWVNETVDPNQLNIFRKTQRRKSFWEPLYIGTNDEPLYEERLSWDGKRDKMSQMLEMCLMNYELLILDNAFLVHAPGIKHLDPKDDKKRLSFMKTNMAIYNSVVRKMRLKYKNNRNC